MKYLWLRLRPYLLLFLVIQALLRLSLMARGLPGEMFSPALLQVLFRGLWLDLVTAGLILTPLALLFWWVRPAFWNRPAGLRLQKALQFVFVYILLFDAVAEHLFWSEFFSRFNFIAVDYLIYTKEVIGNIVESYHVGWILAGLTLLAFGLTRFFRASPPSSANLLARTGGFAAFAIVTTTLFVVSDPSQAHFEQNFISQEVASNGMYNLFHAFSDNEISYSQFYAQHEAAKVEHQIHALLDEDEEEFSGHDVLTRNINPASPEQHKNVMLVVMESMSSEYLGVFGDKRGLTPNLDKLASEGLLFTQAYATGTRTVRGLEAITLSIPPTPGQSIVRRPDNQNLFSLGFIFRDKGYDTRFIYGGYGYFDNMNAFFAGNGFDVVDRTSMSEQEIHFANIWGIADDDLFARAIKEADHSYAHGKPFMQLVMTTSNHRPFTYPEGRIDIPSKTGRSGGVKYADYSIGQLMQWASAKPWYKDTVFVFIADHTSGAAGKVELDRENYHIPAIFYAPGLIKPSRYESIVSQVDMAPILLGQLNFHYQSKFYGEDVLHDDDEVPHAFISNYQKVALVKKDMVTVLEPNKAIEQWDWNSGENHPILHPLLVNDAIAYYQSASLWRKNYRRIPTAIQ